MTKKFSKISIGAIILAAYSAVLANGSNLQPSTSYAKEGFVIGFYDGIGTTLTANNKYSFATGINFGYDFKITSNLLVGLESGLKTVNVHNSEAYTQDAFDLLLTTHYYLYKGLNIFGKAGAAYMISDINSDKQLYKIEPEFNLGVGYTFRKAIDANISFISTIGANDSKTKGAYNAGYLSNPKVYASRAFMFGLSIKL